jgi:hypothetical protein
VTSIAERVARQNFAAGDLGHLAKAPGGWVLVRVTVTADWRRRRKARKSCSIYRNNNGAKSIPNIIVRKEKMVLDYCQSSWHRNRSNLWA